MSTVNLENKTILVTGAAGFIGSNLVKRIFEEVPSATVIGIDNMNAYYDVALKSCPSKAYGIMAASKPILGVLESGSEVRCLIEDTHGGLCCEPGEYDRSRWMIWQNVSSSTSSTCPKSSKKPTVPRSITI